MFSILSTLFICLSSARAQDVPISADLIQRLRETEQVNQSNVLDDLLLQRTENKSPSSFVLADPFFPTTRKIVDAQDTLKTVNGISNHKSYKDGSIEFFQQPVIHEWGNRLDAIVRDAEVCGIRFLDAAQYAYEMKSFATKQLASQAGFLVMHQYHCGACSNLDDLALYLEKRDLAEPGRRCAATLTLRSSKECYMNDIGFSEACSEVWAYNARNSKKVCMNTCVQEYGLLKLLRKQFPEGYINPDGTLRDCILCDELNSVPGYRYSSGLTRRGAGIEAAIQRSTEEMYYIDYRQYYTLFGIQIPE